MKGNPLTLIGEEVCVGRKAPDFTVVDNSLAYGVLIKELRLLARAVFVVDKSGTVTYAEFVRELADEPNYDGVRGSPRCRAQAGLGRQRNL
jgi:peroxiredoxin